MVKSGKSVDFIKCCVLYVQVDFIEGVPFVIRGGRLQKLVISSSKLWLTSVLM